MNFADYLSVLKRRWKLGLAVMVACLFAAVLATVATPKKYSATITFYVSAQSGADNATSAYQGSLLSEQRTRSYAELLTSERVSSQVVRDLNLDEDPGALAQQITAEVQPQTVILSATVTDSSPESASAVANGVGAAFLGLVGELERPINSAQPPTVVTRIVQPAEASATPVSPNIALNLGAGVLLGFLLGLGACLARESLDNTVHSVEDLNSLAGAPNLGVVPEDEGLKSSTATRTTTSPRAAEAFRQIRTNLQFVKLGDHRKSVVVTSSLAGEGKSTTVCNLAATIRMQGLSVVIVDGDLRRPSVGSYLGLDTTVGLTTVLTGRANLSEAMQEWRPAGVQVLTSGAVPPNPSEVVGSQAFADLVGQLHGMFDYVLIDSPPLLPVTDASVMAAHCDGAILICRYEETKKRDISDAVVVLSSVDASVLGTLLTFAPAGKRQGYDSYLYAQAPTDIPEEIDAVTLSTSLGAGIGEKRPSPSPRSGPRGTAGGAGAHRDRGID